LTRPRGTILDTNVVSEPKRPRPDPTVRAWLEAQDPDRLFLTSTVVCELAEGIARMPAGRRRRDLEGWLDQLIEDDFQGRVLVLDADAARLYGGIVANAYAQGRPPRMADAQIAAVATRERMAIATRDTADFEAFGVPLLDPWLGP